MLFVRRDRQVEHRHRGVQAEGRAQGVAQRIRDGSS